MGHLRDTSAWKTSCVDLLSLKTSTMELSSSYKCVVFPITVGFSLHHFQHIFTISNCYPFTEFSSPLFLPCPATPGF